MSPKDQVLVLRLESEDKAMIEKAARTKGQSVTSFVVGAALAESRRVATRPVAGIHGGLPTWVRALCSEAARGGRFGYEEVGRRLTLSIGSECPQDLSPDEWEDGPVEELRAACRTIDTNKEEKANVSAGRDSDAILAIWEWFRSHFPRIMELVPARRRHAFVLGVLDSYYQTDGLRL